MNIIEGSLTVNNDIIISAKEMITDKTTAFCKTIIDKQGNVLRSSDIVGKMNVAEMMACYFGVTNLKKIVLLPSAKNNISYQPVVPGESQTTVTTVRGYY